MLGEDVGSRGRFLLLGNCSCIALLHAILGVMQNLHSHHPWRLAAAKPPWMGLRRSSTGIPHTLKSAKLLKLGIAGITQHPLTDTPVPNFDLRSLYQRDGLNIYRNVRWIFASRKVRLQKIPNANSLSLIEFYHLPKAILAAFARKSPWL